jgi:hypothetical protein
MLSSNRTSQVNHTQTLKAVMKNLKLASTSRSPLRVSLFFSSLVLAWLAVTSQNGLGVTPAPDGGYPGGNTAEGQNALLSLTAGGYNTALGYLSLQSNLSGSFNTATGAGALFLNTATQNTATGAGALFSNASGAENSANGAFALFSNASGRDNTATGASALYSNINGIQNTATGHLALFSNTASYNTADGYDALLNNTTGSPNSAFGWGALTANVTGNYNTAIGYAALYLNNGGNLNTALGDGALYSNNANDNTATGTDALYSNTTGNDNTAVGFQALRSNVAGTYNVAVGAGSLFNNNAADNTAIGNGALFNNITGPSNTAIGFHALFSNTGYQNTAVGEGAGNAVTTAHNVICIGYNVGAANVNDSCFIGNIFNATASGGTTVFVNSNGQLGTSPSSRRFKKDIEPMTDSSEAILALKPVTFHYQNDKSGTSQFGLIAEEVDKVNPDLVVRDKDGKPYSVRYDQVNAMLLNEFLKEHAKVAQLKRDFESRLAQQQKQIEALTAGFQKVSAQIRSNIAAPRPALAESR